MYFSRLYRIFDRDLQRFGCLSWWLMFRVLPTLVVTAFSLLLLSTSQARAQEGLEDVRSGKLLLRAQGEHWSPAIGQSTQLEIRVSGMLASVSLTQAFRNGSENWVEGVYAFPLAENAAVNRMMMQVGERRIVGEIREREQARKIYSEAKAAGKRTSLVEQQRPNLFTNRVANIGPGEIVEVHLEYVQPVQYRNGQFSLRLPTTLTARAASRRVVSKSPSWVIAPCRTGCSRRSCTPVRARTSPACHSP